MSDDHRHHQNRLPEFYLGVSVNGHQIDPHVRAVAERLWPWTWNYIGINLADHAQAAELAEMVAFKVSKFLRSHPGEVRSLVGLYYATTVNLVKSHRSRQGRIDYRGLGQELEAETGAMAPDWQRQVELWILAEQIGNHLDPTVREIFNLRLLERTWEEIGALHGLSAGQARLRFYRALEKLPRDILRDLQSEEDAEDTSQDESERGRS